MFWVNVEKPLSFVLLRQLSSNGRVPHVAVKAVLPCAEANGLVKYQDDFAASVKASALSAVMPFDTAKFPRNRLGLANWTVDKNNPLTARVFVNQIWQEIFGVGLVKTTGDFGMQGN